MTDLHVEIWGSGERVVLVHGSLATGADEWQAQRPLADEAYSLLVPDRRGYGQSPLAQGEDFLIDAEDIAGLMGEGAHLVGHSYGGIGVMLAAARRPEATRSLTVLEPPMFNLGQEDAAATRLFAQVRAIWDQDLPDNEWALSFLHAIGSDPDSLSEELVDAAVPLVPLFRRGRPAWDAELPYSDLERATFPKLVVSGGHHPGFEAICDELSERIGSSRRRIEGAGHEIQFTGPPLNETLLALWVSSPPSAAALSN